MSYMSDLYPDAVDMLFNKGDIVSDSCPTEGKFLLKKGNMPYFPTYPSLFMSDM